MSEPETRGKVERGREMSASGKSFLAECVGTFLLVFVGCGSAILSGHQIGWLGVSLAFGLVLMACCYVIGPVSGCHLNPAVTVGCALSKRCPWNQVGVDIAAQCIGAALAGWALVTIAKGVPYVTLPDGLALNGLCDLSPTKSSCFSGCLGEFFGVFTLVFVVLLATTKAVAPGFAPLAIGGTLAMLLMVLIPLTNGSLNVARSLSVALFAGSAYLKQLLLFAGVHLIAAVAASVVANVLCTKSKTE